MSEVQTLIDESTGIYIPFKFCWDLADLWEEIDINDLTICKTGPGHPQYWDAWENILLSAKFTCGSGEIWFLQQEGDLLTYTGDGEEFV
mgnify:CR=1 FL=1